MCRETCGKPFDIATGLNPSDDATPALCAGSTQDFRVLYAPEHNNHDASLVICAQGIPTSLIDRPGYGGSAADDSGSAIDSGVEAIGALAKHMHTYFPENALGQLVLVGHSFGNAIALSFAVRCPAGFIAAICVSELGDIASSAYHDEVKRCSGDSSDDLSPHWFLGPGKTFDRHSVTALRDATEPQRPHEVFVWPKLWPSVAGASACPIHFRVAEYERTLQTSSEGLACIAAAFKHAARKDTAILPDGGHLYEAHIRGHGFIAAQLDFVKTCSRQLE